MTMTRQVLHRQAARLLQEAGLEGAFALFPVRGGANNQVFRVKGNHWRAMLKVYFQHADDPWDRLGTEFAFSTFAWEHGLRSLPQPLAADREHRLGLYGFLAGRRVRPAEVTSDAVHGALEFYRQLNRHRAAPEARALPVASEACWTIADHLGCVKRRLGRLKAVEASSPIQRDAARLIRGELSEAWEDLQDTVGWQAGRLGLAVDAPIAPEDRRLSPSDFGFHNALLTDEGRLSFIDFEYAGWDDPAKMACDFFCQPAVPVPLAHYDAVVEAVVSDLSEPDRQRHRIALLLDVHRLKWCCILLNEFLPVGSVRRRFADDAAHEEDRQAQQFQKARRALQELGGMLAGRPNG